MKDKRNPHAVELNPCPTTAAHRMIQDFVGTTNIDGTAP